MILETSWEVCNKMGGIYTVLSSRADVMTQHHPAQVCFIGPLLADEGAALPLDFTPGEIPELQGWLREVLPSLGLRVVAGRWGIEGEPPVLLVDFKPLWREKDDLYFELWKAYGLESDKGYGDYDESSLFSIAAARLMASIAAWRSDERTIAIFNEWQTAMGLLYLRQQAPSVRTLFITHATTVGRSIAGNDKELYTYMDAYDGDQMARELGVEAKHEVEKLAAHKADVFATVSKLTAREAKQLLGREPVVLPNGFHVGTSPLAAPMLSKRRKSRRLLAAVASRLYGQHIDPAATRPSSSHSGGATSTAIRGSTSSSSPCTTSPRAIRVTATSWPSSSCLHGRLAPVLTCSTSSHIRRMSRRAPYSTPCSATGCTIPSMTVPSATSVIVALTAPTAV